MNKISSDDKKLEADILSQLGVEVTPAYEKEGLHSDFPVMEPDISFAQTNSGSGQMEKEKERTEVSSESTSTSTQSMTSKFFYVDDFFYWLGCKFVTCDKPKSPEQSSHQDSSISVKVIPHPEMKEVKTEHKTHRKYTPPSSEF